ncbi:MAG: M61 family peptidase [Bacteroidia bacterium]|jgi:predicted metalloprotease with PDZ domain|nr:M61 family peptidase [Bacteroidia bacterium]
MHYIFSWSNPQSRYITITAIAENVDPGSVDVQLPSWRPGRYELGNFAKNVRGFRAETPDGQPLKSEKISKDLWRVQCTDVSTLYIVYEYYAAELNAGSTWLDQSQLYVNPVNCCVYLTDRLDEVCTVELQLPEGWRVATALQQPADHILVASDFDRLADSPFIASPTLQHNFFVLDGVEFHLWFQGECRPDWSRIIADSFIYVNEIMQIFGSCPAEKYHFLYQILPHRFYHGVEHTDSTVIALGPPYRLMNELYGDFLGVSCHELFHAWNIKAIRPADMMPYDFTRENYSRLGYVCEGVTTYYGDYLLFRSGVFTEHEYWHTFEERLEKHFHSHGRHFLSVADSSFDTWLDGYVPGAPHRKTSIYHEGCLLAFITDIFIRRHTANTRNLDHVMRRLWTDYGQKGKGYTEADYKRLVEEISGKNFDHYWNVYFYQSADYTEPLDEALEYIGCKINRYESSKIHEDKFGFRLIEQGGISKITEVYFNSPAELAGLAVNDEIVAIQVNGRAEDPIPVKADLQEWLRYFDSDSVILVVNSGGAQKFLPLKADGVHYYPVYKVSRSNSLIDSQKASWKSWSGRP